MNLFCLVEFFFLNVALIRLKVDVPDRFASLNPFPVAIVFLDVLIGWYLI